MIRKIEKNSREYPERLIRLSDPPKILNVQGIIPCEPMIAIIGTRKSDIRINKFTENLAGDLAKRGYVILSGGALGVDTAAHKGALDVNGKTVSVLGSGFDYLYPKSNKSLFDAIKEKGALISEFPDNTPPSKWSFPRRNRLVAAMSSAVIVVSAPVKSGALITARIARNIGVPVGAVPSAPGDFMGEGCNLLIKGGSAMITNVTDVIKIVEKDNFSYQLKLPVNLSMNKNGDNAGKSKSIKDFNRESTKLIKGLSEEEKKIWLSLCFEPVHIDDIATQTGLSPKVVGSTLLKMEITGLIQDTGAKRFVKL